MLLDMSSKSPFSDGIRRIVLKKRVNLAIIITSASEYKTQMRKSTIGLALSYLIQPTFDMNKQFAIIKTKNFLDVLNREDLKRGSVLFLDEFGVGMEHHEWRNFLVRSVHKTMETHGHEGKILIVTVPVKSYVDSDSKKLFNIHIEILRKNEEEKYAVCRVKILNYNDKVQKLYEKYPRGRFKDGRIRAIKEFKIRFPPEEIMEKYFKISDEAKLSLKYSLKDEVIKIEQKKIKTMFNPEECADYVISHLGLFLKERYGKKYIGMELVMNHFSGLGQTRARQVKAIVERRLNLSGGVDQNIPLIESSDTNAEV